MTLKTNSPYFDTLQACVTQIEVELAERRAVTVNPDWAGEIYRKGHVAYSTRHNFDFELNVLKEKPTRKWFHVNIERLDNGRYELNCYVL